MATDDSNSEKHARRKGIGDALIRLGVSLGGGPRLGRHERTEESPQEGAVDIVDQAEAETMEALERRVLAGLGAPDPYAPGANASHGD